SSEGNVVVTLGKGAGSSAGAHRRRLEVTLVDEATVPGGGRRSAPAGGVLARAQELHRLGNDVDCLALCPVLAVPLAPLQAPVDRHRASLGEILGCVLALRATHGDVEIVGLILPLSRTRVLTACVARDS